MNLALTPSEARPFASLIERIDQLALQREAVWHFPHRRQSWRYRDLVLQAQVAARYLAGQGVGRDHRIALVIANGPEFVVALLALWRLGAVAVPLRHAGGRHLDYAEHLGHFDRAVRFSGLIADATAPLDAIERWSHERGKPVWDSAALMRVQDSVDGLPAVGLSPGAPALLQLTSGSTGRPKAVIITHGMVEAQLDLLLGSHRDWAGREPKVLASWLPLNHDAGLFFGVLIPLACACDNLLATPEFYMRRPLRWFELMAEHRVEANFVTNSSTVAACRAFRRLDPDKAATLDLSRLHIIFGGEKLQVEVLRRFETAVAPMGLAAERLHVGYGMAENTLCATRSPTGRIACRRVCIDDRGRVREVEPGEPGATGASTLVSVGSALPGYRVAIRDDLGRALTEDRVGEVWVKGRCISPGYFQNRQATRERFRAGWLVTGDLGFMHQGELYFVSRKDDLLNIGGVNVVPDDIEQWIEDSVAAVRPGGACMLGVRNGAGSTVATLLFESTGHGATDAHADPVRHIDAILRQRFELTGVAVVAVARGTIETNSAGKKRRKVIAGRFVSSRWVEPEPERLRA